MAAVAKQAAAAAAEATGAGDGPNAATLQKLRDFASANAGKAQ